MLIYSILDVYMYRWLQVLPPRLASRLVILIIDTYHDPTDFYSYIYCKFTASNCLFPSFSLSFSLSIYLSIYLYFQRPSSR